MKRISTERKTAVLEKLLPPYNMTVAAVAQMEGSVTLNLERENKQLKSIRDDNYLDTYRSALGVSIVLSSLPLKNNLRARSDNIRSYPV